MSYASTINSLPEGFILEEYRLERVLGIGTFGITYKGWDNNLNTPVAIKEFFPSELVEREGNQVKPKPGEDVDYYQFGLNAFIEEVRILAQFKHSNIIRVLRYFTSNGTAYFVMDYEDGGSLSEYLNTDKETLSEDRLRAIFIPILEGLSSVHSKKYLHRDIKPSNIYLRNDGTPILLDFGAARLEFGSTSQSGECVLTPGYAPIEQYAPDGIQGPWSDLYGVGATLYRCVTGRTPADAVNRLNALQRGQTDPLPPASLIAKGKYNPEFLKAIDWALSLKQEARPQTVGQFLERMSVTLSGVTISSIFTYKPRQAVRNHKIVFCGPVGAGKTTAISVLSDTSVIGTDQMASDMTRLKKAATTVAMDYGIMKLNETERVHLFGTPGQERFDFMWDILQKGALGLVLLIDNSSKSPLDDLEFYLQVFSELIAKTKVVIGVNFMDSGGATTIEDYHRALLDKKRPFKINPPVFEIDARSKRDMSMLVQALLYSIDPGVQDYNV
ncbi:MAG: protein kinase [Sideroxydans sp.]|nr:protein kinase [Sideroxydans sp.]